MPDTLDRAERAFRDALAAAAREVDPAPLDPAALRARAEASSSAERGASDSVPRSRRWLPVAAAAAVAVVVVPVGVLLTQRNLPAPAMSGAPASAPSQESRDAATPQAPAAGGVQALQPGFRWASLGDVVVQVPQAWGFARAVGPDWCVEGAQRQPGDPSVPFVDVRPEGRAVRSIGCDGDVPAARQTMHLTWRHADAPASARTPPSGWVAVDHRVGSMVLTVVAPVSEKPLAERVLASARQVAVDHLGCPTVAPVTPAHPDAKPADIVVADVVGEPVVLCQYDDLSRSAANLVGSRALPGAPPELLEVAGTSTATPPRGECLPDARGDTLVVVAWPRTAGLQQWVRVPSCGTSQLVTGRGAVPATTALCRAVFVAPLSLPDAGQEGDACLAARTSR